MAKVKPHVNSAPAAVKNAREASLGVKGCQLFNLLPGYIRNTRGGSIENFKSSLDIFLSTIPDQPTVPGFARAAESNSLVHQLALRAAQEGLVAT